MTLNANIFFVIDLKKYVLCVNYFAIKIFSKPFLKIMKFESYLFMGVFPLKQ